MTKLFWKEPKLYDAGGDLSKQWFVFYSFQNPKTHKFERFKVFRDINATNLKFERYERAKAIQTAIKELLQEGFNPYEEFQPDTTFSVTNCIDIFLEAVKPPVLKQKSYNRYLYEFRLLKQWFIDQGLEDLHVSKVKKTHIISHLAFAEKHGEWTSGKTFNTHKSNLSRLFNHFIRNYDEVIEKNPVTYIESRPQIIRGNRPYNEKEFELIQTEILKNDPYLWRICQFVYYAAVRNEQEGLNVKVGMIDFQSDTINLPGSITKAKESQQIPIYPEFREILLTWGLAKMPVDWYVFGRGDQPGPVRVGKDNFYDRFKKIRANTTLSKDHGIYAFKHTRACHMVDDGSSLYEIQKLFRHKSLQATMEYLKSIGRVVGEKKLSKSRKI